LLLLVDKIKVSLLFVTTAVLFVLLRAVSIDDFLSSFSNKSVITIFLLIYLTAVVHKNFPLLSLMDKVFSRAKTPRAFIFQMTTAVSGFSSVMNNTPIVTLFIPYVYQWGKKHKVAPSKLLIPLSYAAIFGGMITVIGTSTNLVLNSFLRSNNEKLLSFSDFLIPGLVVSVAGIIFLTLFYNRLLPNRGAAIDETQGVLREYLAETRLEEDSDLVGKTIAEAGLRNLDGVYLAQIYRNGRLLSSVTPDMELMGNDRLYFAGDTLKVIDVLKQFPTIVWAKNEKFALGDNAELVETVVPANSFLQGKSLKEVAFRDRYDAAVIAIHRNGEKAEGKLGEIELTAGDLLLLMAGPNFKNKISQGKDLYALQWLEDQSPKSSSAQKYFLASLVAFIGLSIFGSLDFFIALVLSLLSAAVLGLFDNVEAKKQTSIDLLLILGGAITVGKGFIDTGAAQLLINPLMSVISDWNQISIIVVLYAITVLFTSFVTNVAAVSIIFPLAFELIHDLGLNPTATYLALAFGASAAFLTPVSYQTNLMVYGPGKYAFKDFVKIGLPFTLLYSLCALISIFALHKLV
jgi:di/tricarboxylate transporter